MPNSKQTQTGTRALGRPHIEGGTGRLAVARLDTWLLGELYDLPSVFSLQAIALTVGDSTAIGIFFGVVPAWRAARPDPIVALRYK